MKKSLVLSMAALAAVMCVPADLFAQTARVVREAEHREAIRQNTQWTPKNISEHPDLFLRDQIGACDILTKKIKAQQVAFLRLGKEAERKVADADAIINRYTKWLAAAKEEYKKVSAGTAGWPLVVNGFEIEESDFDDLVADALERIDLAEKSKKTNSRVSQKVKIRQNVLKTRSREVVSIRRKLSLQLENVKMNQALSGIDEMQNVLNIIKDMAIELSEDPTKLTVEDMTTEDPNESRRKSVEEFLNS